MIDKNERFYIGTTRFTNKTYKENSNWRKKHGWKGCIYGLNKQISESVQPMALVYVIEMNNDENRIEGFGLVRNYFNRNNSFYIYKKDTNYNRYIYNSQYRKDISEIDSPKLIEMLEALLFTGYGHYKRGQGITTIDWTRFNELGQKVMMKFFQNLFN